MRQKSFEEFESLFERASIPVFDLPRIAPASIAVTLTDSVIDSSLLELTASMVQRFSASGFACWPASMDLGRAASLARKYKLKPCAEEFASYKELGVQLNDLDIQLAVLGINPDASAVETGIDSMVFGCNAPVLIVRQPIADPAALFSRVLHSLSGDLQEIRHLAYSFSLVAHSGSLTLLHTVDESEIDDLRDTLKVSPGVSTSSGKQLLKDLAVHAERYLKGMVRASHDESYTVSYRLGEGDVLDIVQYELAEGDYSLLVVGTHADGVSRIDADEYQLMHQIKELPVLAL